MAKKKVQKVNKATVAAGAGLVAAAAAGAYFLFGTKEGKKTQKKMKGWMVKAKGEVMDKLEDMKDVSEDSYYDVVDKVTKKYSKLKKVQGPEIESLVKDLRKHWKNIKKELVDEKPKKKIVKKKTATKKKTAAKKK